MLRIHAKGRLIVRVGFIGALVGILFAVATEKARAAEGGGGYICTSPSHCGAGNYNCSVVCGSEGCHCLTW